MSKTTTSTASAPAARAPYPGVQHALNVTSILESNGIPCCVVRVEAIRFYGAPARVSRHWDITVPDKDVARAVSIFDKLKAKYEPKPLPPNPAVGQDNGIHARFALKGVSGVGSFYFALTSSSQCCIDPASAAICRSANGIPYAAAAAILGAAVVWYDFADFTDVVDGLDLQPAWLDENLDWAHLTAALNKHVEAETASRRQLSLSGPMTSSAAATPEPYEPDAVRDIFMQIAQDKEKARRLKHYEPRRGVYVTRFRKQGSRCPTADPRA